jgi:CHAT domain-containing protein
MNAALLYRIGATMLGLLSHAVFAGLPDAATDGDVSGTRTLAYASEITVEGVSTGDVHGYVLDVPAGGTLISLDQDGLDFRLHLLSPHEAIYNAPSFRDERETVLIQAEQATTIRLRVDSDEYTGATGNYTIGSSRLTNEAEVRAYSFIDAAVLAISDNEKPDWRAALGLYSRAFSTWYSLGNTREQARTKLYWHAGEWQQAADAAADAAFLYQQLGESALHANATYLQGMALVEVAAEAKAADEQRNLEQVAEIYSQALDLFGTAMQIQEHNGQWYDRAQTLNYFGLTYHNQQRWAEAIPYYNQAAAEFRRLDEWSAEMNPVANLAVADQDSGQLMRAAATQEKLLEMMPADREPAWRADTLDNYARAKLILGDTDAALTNFFAALKLHESISDLTGQGYSLTGIGATYRMVGEIDLARGYFEQALPIRTSINDTRGQASVLRALAEIDITEHQYESALTYLDAASRFDMSPIAVAGIKIQKAQAWLGSGQLERAELSLSSAREEAAEIGSTRLIADVAFWTGKLHQASNDADASFQWFSNAAELYESIDVRSGEAGSLLELARLRLDADDTATAIEFGTAAVDRIEGLRSEVTSMDLRAVYLGARAEYYEVLIESLMRAYEQAGSPQAAERYVFRALETSERGKARATVDLINEASVDLSKSIDADIAASLTTLNEQLAETQLYRNRLLENGKQQAQLDDTLKELLRLRAELDVLESDARNSSPLYASVKKPQTLRAPEMQRALGPEEVLLQYWLGENTGIVWVVSQRDIVSVMIPGRNQVNRVARRLHNALSRPRLDSVSRRQRSSDVAELSEMIIAPVADELSGASTIVVAADGALQFVPLGILLGASGKPLISTHQVVSVPSMTVISALRSHTGGSSPPEKVLAIVGDPVFSLTDPRIESPEVSPAGNAGADGSQEARFRRLPFSGHEVETIAGLVAESDRFVATGLDASASAVAGSNLKDYRYVHFATHGVIDSAQPVSSSLIFSMRDSVGNPEDGFFRLRDVYNMELTADLVVLSACETALGREVRGEGLLGLTQGFLYAGTKSVVASLWQVSDRATAELMAIFYKNMLVDGDRPARALSKAQLEFSQDRRWSDPYFWSGFVVLGEWL